MKINDVASTLKMNDLYVCQCSFKRIPGDFTDFELQFSLNRETKANDDGTYEVVLEVLLTNAPHEFDLQITIVGNFEVDAVSKKIEKELIEKNTVAIMFPYLRSQITLMSSQPGMKPIVLPPLNIDALIQEQIRELAE